MRLKVSNLDRAVGRDKLILEVGRPQAQACQVHQQVLVHNRKLSTEYPPHIYVAGVWLKALVVSKNLQDSSNLVAMRIAGAYGLPHQSCAAASMLCNVVTSQE